MIVVVGNNGSKRNGDDRPFPCPPGEHRPIRGPNEYYCAVCGVVSDLPPSLLPPRPSDMIDNEGRIFAGSDTSVRIALRESTLKKGTKGNVPIDVRALTYHRDFYGNPLPRASQKEFRRLRHITVHSGRWNRSSLDARAQTILGRVKERLNVPMEALVDAGRLAREASEEHVVPSPLVEDRSAASIFVVLRSSRWRIGVPISDVVEATGANRRNMMHIVNRLKTAYAIYWEPVTAEDHFRYYAGRFNLSTRERTQIEEWLKDPDVKDGPGVSPIGMVAGAIFLAGRLFGGTSVKAVDGHRTQDLISRTMNVTAVTIRSSYNLIEERLREAKKL